MKKVIIILSVLVALGVLGYVFTVGMGRPISTDLSQVGQGRPTLVLAYENYSPEGGAALTSLGKIRNRV